MTQDDRKFWSVDEAKRILSSAQIRWGEAWYGKVAEILVDGEWLHLCRTDLKDDVCTGNREDAKRSLEENREFYMKKIAYGARVTVRGTGFSVIDGYSDG